MKRRKHSPSAKKERQDRLHQLANVTGLGSPAARLIGVTGFVRAQLPGYLLMKEPALCDTCWVEYAYMTPLKRTQMFTHDFVSVFRRKWAQYFDYRTGSEKCPAEEEFALNTPSEMTALWTARQHADAIGIPYMTYLLQVFEHAAQVEGHSRLLRPNQLYSDPQVAHVVAYWGTHRQVASLDVEEWDERFMAANYTGDLAQRRLQDLIQERVKCELGVASYMIYRPIVPEAVARGRFGDELVDRAISMAGPVPAFSWAACRPYVPSCLGLAVNVESCKSCAFATLCATVGERTERQMEVVYGSSDPLADQRRTKNRERKQRQRMRERSRHTGDDSGSCRSGMVRETLLTCKCVTVPGHASLLS